MALERRDEVELEREVASGDGSELEKVSSLGRLCFDELSFCFGGMRN